MSRKLLKRKLKFKLYSKLKTVNRRHTRLGLRASNSVSKINQLQFHKPYPGSNYVNHRTLPQRYLKNMVCGSLDPTLWQTVAGLDPLTHYKKSTDSLSIEAANVFAPKVHQTKYSGLPNLTKSTHTPKQVNKEHLWHHYLWNATFTKGLFFPWHYKHIYSLDQIICNQYNNQYKSKNSVLNQSLMEKKKIQLLYGPINKKQVQRINIKKPTNPQKTKHIAWALESRLDVLCKEAFVFSSLRFAQHWISQGRILVNQKTVTIPSQQLRPGDMLSIAKDVRRKYQNYILSVFYRCPKQNKYVLGNKLLSRWRDWAEVYNQLSFHKKHIITMNNTYSQNKTCIQHTHNRSMNAFLYHSGRYFLNRFLGKKPNHNVVKSKFVETHELATQNITKYNPYYTSQTKALGCPRVFLRWLFLAQRFYLKKERWKHGKTYKKTNTFAYKQHTIVFSRWLLQKLPLILDGLYNLRFLLPFIQRKNSTTKTNHMKLSLQKPMHLEINYKNLSAIYLYPPQRKVWPCMIDFKRVL